MKAKTAVSNHDDLRVGWIISKDRAAASSRLQGYLVDDWLRANGTASQIVASNFNKISGLFSIEIVVLVKKLLAGNFTHLIFEAPEWTACQISAIWKWLQPNGISIGIRCDNIKSDYDRYFDLTICPTIDLATSLNIVRHRIIPDSVEVSPDRRKNNYSLTGRMKVVWVGHQGYESYISELIEGLLNIPTIKENIDFVKISKGTFANRQWSESTVVDDILNCDAAIIPIPLGEWYKSKSSNRLAMMMALAMPTVATEIASYSLLAENGREVIFVAPGKEGDFGQALEALLNEKTRLRLGNAARQRLGDQFSIEQIGPIWREALLSATSVCNPMTGHGVKLLMYAYVMRLLGP